MTLKEIKCVLETQQLHPNKRFGQNFLHDQNLCQWIVKEAALNPEEMVWEIGPGLGSLTEWLLPVAKKVEAIEIDRGFIRYLKEKWGNCKNFKLHEGDALALMPDLISSNASCVVGNLPYSITSPLLVAFLEKNIPPKRMVFTLQYEVADRLLAQLGSRNCGALSVMINVVYEVKLLKKLSPSVFYPQPEVFSAVVSFIRKEKIESAVWRKLFFPWIRKAFNQKRKQLINLLSKQFPLGKKMDKKWADFFKEKNWNIKMRAEELSLNQWKELFNYYLQMKNGVIDNNL